MILLCLGNPLHVLWPNNRYVRGRRGRRVMGKEEERGGGEEEERRGEGACDHMTLIAVGCVT